MWLVASHNTWSQSGQSAAADVIARPAARVIVGRHACGDLLASPCHLLHALALHRLPVRDCLLKRHDGDSKVPR
eukprot:s4755_g5.t1